MEEKFIGYIEGYLATTNVDSQGDKLSPEGIEQFADTLSKNPQKRTLFLSHDITQPIGYVTEFHIETKGLWKGIFAKVGIYKSRPDVWRMIQSGELKGFSYGAKVLEMKHRKSPNPECSFSVEVRISDWHIIKDTLSQMGAHVEAIVQKAADFPTILNVTMGILALPGTIYGLYTLYQKLSGRDKNRGTWMKISTTKRKFNFEDNTVEEIVTEIEMNSKDSKSSHG